MSNIQDVTEQLQDAATADAAGEGADENSDATATQVVEPDTQNLIEIDEALQLRAADIFDNMAVFFDVSLWAQVAIVMIMVGLAMMIGRRLSEKLDQKIATLGFKTTRKISVKVIRRLPRLIVPAVAAVSFYLIAQIVNFYGGASNLLFIASALSFAMLMVIFAVSFIKSKVLSRWIAKLAVLITALHLFGWWDATIATMENIRFGIGLNQITLLSVLKGLMYFAIFLWFARLLSAIFEKQIKAADELTPSLKVLFSKLLKFTLIFVALMFGLNAIGVDLTTVAIFGGAIGVGLGFGLQKVVSNFISGIILLMDRSIKPGDVIAIDGPDGNQTFGWVNTLGARYVSIIRRDGKEHLIPNEVMITERVENWSFSNNDIRISIPVGVSYNCDLAKARELCLEAAAEEPRVKEFPKPICHVTGFGDSSVDLEIRAWINDPVNGIGNVRSEILMRVWDKFHEHKVEIPFPQRDLHFKSINEDVLEKLKKEIVAELKSSKATG